MLVINDLVEFDFPYITVTPGDTYYIVVETTLGSWYECYNWCYSTSDTYADGKYHQSYY